MASLVGIARHARPRGRIETLDAVEITLDKGVDGDWRGLAKPGSKRRRQVTIMAREAWDAALADLGAEADWSARRVNLLIEGAVLPRASGSLVRIGDVVFEVTVECEPCERMNAVVPGLFTALLPDWRGGVCTRVATAGRIALGDTIRIEEAL